jgi:hypothetical protein
MLSKKALVDPHKKIEGDIECAGYRKGLDRAGNGGKSKMRRPEKSLLSTSD